MDTTRRNRVPAARLLIGLASLCFAFVTGDALAASSVTLRWTSPGDDAFYGTAASYDLRYSTSPITDQDFLLATPVPGVPPPAPVGTRQQVTITGLDPGTQYFFALQTVDDAGNSSPLASATYTTSGTPTRPTAIVPISLSAPYPNPSRHYVQLDLTLPRAMPVRVHVLDLGGRLVKTLAERTYPAGTTLLAWDTTDDHGVRLRGGQYWVRGVIGTTTFSHRLAVVP
jgi:hypothetical protein